MRVMPLKSEAAKVSEMSKALLLKYTALEKRLAKVEARVTALEDENEKLLLAKENDHSEKPVAAEVGSISKPKKRPKLNVKDEDESSNVFFEQPYYHPSFAAAEAEKVGNDNRKKRKCCMVSETKCQVRTKYCKK